MTLAPALARWAGLLTLALTVVTPLGLNAQVTDCTSRYNQAQRLFEAGKLREAAELLQPCLDNRLLGRAARRNVLALAAENYAFLEEPAAALQALFRIYQMDPFYTVRDSVPELKYLRERILIVPRHFILLSGGLVSTHPRILAAYPPDGVTILEQNFARRVSDPVSFSAQFRYGRGFGKGRVALQVGMGVARYSFRYQAELSNATNFLTETRGNATLGLLESQVWLQNPVQLLVVLAPGDKVIQRRWLPYVQVGLLNEWLLPGTARIDQAQISFGNNQQSQIDLGLTDYRRSFNTGLQLGLGLRWRLQATFLQVELQYARQAFNLAVGERYENQVLNHQDNDFILEQLSLHLGIGLYGFKSAILGR